MILDIFVILMFMVLILFVIKLIKKPEFKINKEIPVTRMKQKRWKI